MAAFAADSPTVYAGGERITTVIRPDRRTGRLVRSVIVVPRAVPPPKAVPEIAVSPRVVEPLDPAAQPKTTPASAVPASLDEAVDRIAADQQLPVALIHSVIKVESNYNPNAVSPKGAQGLMQLIPSTARRFGVADSFNPVDNIQGGARYLKYLLDLNGGNYALALAAYNAGEGAVAKYGDIPPYPETVNYVQSVATELRKQTAAARSKSPAAKADSKPEAPKTTRIVEIHEADGSVRYVSR
ncbi:MAG TPA: lytic transglycosylase domain-containing protein [Bryobacteraceae bacterium]|nr:lytic transglycosylase domain-containing protein [Bryobacteraceae bacterium]